MSPPVSGIWLWQPKLSDAHGELETSSELFAFPFPISTVQAHSRCSINNFYKEQDLWGTLSLFACLPGRFSLVFTGIVKSYGHAFSHHHLCQEGVGDQLGTLAVVQGNRSPTVQDQDVQKAIQFYQRGLG